jgi:hypothetical protein
MDEIVAAELQLCQNQAVSKSSCIRIKRGSGSGSIARAGVVEESEQLELEPVPGQQKLQVAAAAEVCKCRKRAVTGAVATHSNGRQSSGGRNSRSWRPYPCQ